MKFDLNITNSQIVFSYSRNMEIRKRVFEFENVLKEQFNTPFRTVAIPDELDPNIPRFESQSKHGHSRIQVAQTRMTLATSFNKKLTKTEAYNYLNEKRLLLTDLANSEKIDFIAYVIELNCYLPEESINSILIENTGVKALDKNCRDFTLLYSRVYKNDFYLNVKCSKFSEQELILESGAKELKHTNNIKHGISITLDLNSKVFYEKNKKFEHSLYKQIENHVFNLIQKKSLQDYLKGNI